MPRTQEDYRIGMRLGPNQVSLVANSTPVTIHQATGQTAAGTAVQVGAGSFVIRKIRAFNGSASLTRLQFGTDTGSGFTQGMADFVVIAGMDAEWTEDQIPNFEFTSAARVQATIAGAGALAVVVSIEVEEFDAASAPV